MITRQIKLNATEDVQEFVNEAAKCSFDIDISYNRIIIDAKSLLGILSMDLTRELTVSTRVRSILRIPKRDFASMIILL